MSLCLTEVNVSFPYVALLCADLAETGRVFVQSLEQHAKNIVQPISVAELDFPISYLRQELQRHVDICHCYLKDEIFGIMCSGTGQEIAALLSLFLNRQLLLHMEDEQKELFPRLMGAGCSKSLKSDIQYLSREQEFDKDIIEFVMEDLEILCKGRHLTNSLRLELNLRTLLEGLAKHAKWESETLLVAAEERLGQADLRQMAINMKDRRVQ